MSDKHYCINCYNFYIEEPSEINKYKMKHSCTIENLKKVLDCNEVRGVNEYYEEDFICKKCLKYKIDTTDTYLKQLRVLIIHDFDVCKDRNRFNECKDYKKIEYDPIKPDKSNSDNQSEKEV